MRGLDWHHRLQLIDVAADGAECPIDRATALARFHAQEHGGPVVSGAAAFAAMWRALPLLRPLGLLARLPPMLMLLEWLYLAFLRVRPRLQALARGGHGG